LSTFNLSTLRHEKGLVGRMRYVYTSLFQVGDGRGTITSLGRFKC